VAAPSPAFRLQREEALGKGIARMAHGRIGHALDELGGLSGSTPETAVHEARKDVKKLRALLRLVRSGTTSRVRRRENEALRGVGRSLSGVRDSDVMLATLAGLEESVPAELAPEVVAPLRAQVEEHRNALAVASTDTSALELTRIRERVRTWTPAGDDFGVVRDGLERAYRRGREALSEARRDPTPENLHEWRKRVKDHWYNLSVLRDVWPPVMRPLADAAHQLSELLGDANDLAVLLEFASSYGTDPACAERAAALAAVVEPRREQLRAEAFALGERIYAEKPRAFARRMEKLFEAWRSAAR
jgi:CHAD domain-containing protein